MYAHWFMFSVCLAVSLPPVTDDNDLNDHDFLKHIVISMSHGPGQQLCFWIRRREGGVGTKSADVLEEKQQEEKIQRGTKGKNVT